MGTEDRPFRRPRRFGLPLGERGERLCLWRLGFRCKARAPIRCKGVSGWFLVATVVDLVVVDLVVESATEEATVEGAPVEGVNTVDEADAAEAGVSLLEAGPC